MAFVCGIEIKKSQFSFVSLCSPDPSLPIMITSGKGRLHSSRSCPPFSAPAIQKPFSFKMSMVWLAFATLETGICSSAPADAFATVSFTPAALHLGIITPAAPKATQFLIMAPKLCGSSIPSSKTRMLSFFRFAADISSSISIYSIGETSAATPCEFCAYLSSFSGGTLCTAMALLFARAIISPIAFPLAVRAIIILFTVLFPALSNSSTGFLP